MFDNQSITPRSDSQLNTIERKLDYLNNRAFPEVMRWYAAAMKRNDTTMMEEYHRALNDIRREIAGLEKQLAEPTPPDDLQPTHCPVCGQDLDIQTQTFPHTSFDLFTCWNEQCSVYGRTATAHDLCDLSELWKWRAMLRFDPVSGLAIPLFVTYSNECVGSPWSYETAASRYYGKGR